MNNLKFKGVIILIILLCLIGLPSQIISQDGDTVEVSKQVDPLRPALGGEVSISLTLSGSNEKCDPQLTTDIPLDVVLAIDNSGSMLSSGNVFEDLICLFGKCKAPKLDNAKEAAITLLDEMNPATDHIAVVKFSNTATLLQPLGSPYNDVKQTINAIVGEGGTALDKALERSGQELMSSDRLGEAVPVLIILSDGASNPNRAKAAAETVRANEIRVISVGVGEDINANLMIDIAGSRDDYYFSPNSNDLSEIYRSIAQQLRRAVGATDLHIEHRYDTKQIELISDSISNDGLEIEPGTIVWQIPALHNRSETLSYQAKVLGTGSFAPDVGDSITYVRCEAEARTLQLPPSLRLQLPTATPSPTPLATATPTATPTPPPGILGITGPEDLPWWLCLIPLLLLLLLGLLLWRRWSSSPSAPRTTRKPGSRSRTVGRVRDKPSKRRTGKDITHGRR